MSTVFSAEAPRPFLYSDIQAQINKLRELAIFALPSAIVNSGEYEIFRFKMYLVLEEPRSSVIALVVNFFLSLCIIGSTIIFAIETVPSEEQYQSVWWNFEIFFVSIFICEYLLRLWARRVSLLVFVTRPMNIIDLLAVVPFFLELTVLYTGGYLDMRFLRSVRLLRLFKFGRHSTQLQLITGGLKKSIWPLALVFLMLALALVMFGTAMFMVERGSWDQEKQCYVRTDGLCSPFESIPKSFWWGIATLTTVGYGDVYPITVQGRLVAAVAMIAGIVCVALPTTVLGVQFSEAYGDLKAQMEMDGLRNATEGNTVGIVDSRKANSESTRAANAANRLVTALDALNAIKKDLEMVIPAVRNDLLILANPDALDSDDIDTDGEPMGAADLASRALSKKSGSLDAVVERSIAVLAANSVNSIQSYIKFVLGTTEEYFTVVPESPREVVKSN
jgi:voltage-gated potassium channel